MNLLRIWCITILLILLHLYTYSQPCNLQLSGHVIDSALNSNLANAVVTLLPINKKILTSNKGDFAFENICPGNYTLIISHLNCATYTRLIQLQKNVHLDVPLPHTYNTMGEATVIGVKERLNTGYKKELTGVALQATNGTNFAQVLSNINGVTLLQTGATVAKPILHGLSGNRLLIVNNGVRLEGQQWGNEHAPEVDPFLADKIVILKGVDELKYGSDAIAGVILVEPKPMQTIQGKNLVVNTGFFSNNRQVYFNSVYQNQLKTLPWISYRIQGTVKKAANSATPNYRLNNTALEEVNYSLSARVAKHNMVNELFYSSFYTNLGIFAGAHIGNITDLKSAIAAAAPSTTFTNNNTYNIARPNQLVNHHTIKWKNSITNGKSKLNTLVAAQFNKRQEYDVVRLTTNKNPQIVLNINTLNEDINWEHKPNQYTTSTIGIAASQQQNTYSGRYLIPNYTNYTTGGYVLHKWAKHNWELQAGARYDNKQVNTRRLRINNNFSAYKFDYNTYAINANATYKVSSNYSTNINVSKSSRAPYVNELLSDGIHHGTATYERGDISLNPENSWYISSNHSYNSPNKQWSIEALFYINTIKNFIYQQPLPNEPVLTIAGAFPLMQYKQTNATLTGSDVSIIYQPVPSITATLKYAMLLAKNNTANDWLILMPPNSLSTSIAYNLANYKAFTNSTVTLTSQSIATQNRIPTKSGIQDYKEAPQGVTLLNLQLQTNITLKQKPILLTLSAQNIFNTSYRNYLNSFRYYSDEVGRNIAFKVSIPII